MISKYSLKKTPHKPNPLPYSVPLACLKPSQNNIKSLNMTKQKASIFSLPLLTALTRLEKDQMGLTQLFLNKSIFSLL